MPDPDHIRNQGTHKTDKDDLIRQHQAEHGGTGGQDRTGQHGGKDEHDKQQRGGHADNTRQ